MMKKRILALLLVLTLMLGICPTAWASDTAASVQQTVQTLGIMVGDADGQMRLDSPVSRAELTKMLTAASKYKDTLGEVGSGFSLFSDVKQGHWASEYIRLAVEQGWVVGYVDGTFRPDKTVTLEEACATLLRLLGYGSEDLAGSYPQAQLSKAAAIGLRDQVSAGAGEELSRRDCMYLFYNLLTADTKDGQVYAETLGYKLSGGEVDYASVLSDNLSGPFVYGGGGLNLPFGTDGITVYRDGKKSSLSALTQYDVYYYNSGVKTLWAYSDRVSGSISSLSPNAAAPTQVTVAGNTYDIGSSEATYALSALAGAAKGDKVTLLFGMDGSVVSVLSGSTVDAVYYGVVQGYRKIADGDNASVKTELTVACTDGVAHTFTLDKERSFATGQLVSVNVNGGETTAQSISKRTLSGRVSNDASKLGTYTLAAGAQIIDTDDDGNFVAVTPERLAGASLAGSDVKYYLLDGNNQITSLILDDATGDIWNYGYLIEVKSSQDGKTETYRFVTGGEEYTLSPMNTSYAVEGGKGITLQYQDGQLENMQNIESVKLTSLSATMAYANNQSYELADGVQVYLKKDKGVYATDIDTINTNDYTVTGYYDSARHSAGGLIRVLVAVQK